MKYELVIGLEIHAQVSVQTKMFCACSTDSFEKRPNTNVCPICMGFPGQLPVLNKAVVEKGRQAAQALHLAIAPLSKFDRKNYFYPDLPKGFQISQYDLPISTNGYLDITVSGAEKRIRIHRLHLEDDAGKLVHGAGGTLLDFNRSGMPLMEIVTEPDLRSATEAVLFAKEVQAILRYVGASEADMEKGMMRFDASVSIRKPGETQLNERAEIKNLNSFKALEAAIDYEAERQKKLAEAGTPLKKMQTVGWSEGEGKTKLLREKESAEDYRYFAEPDLPPLSGQASAGTMPEMPQEKKRRYQEIYKLTEHDAALLAADRALAEYFEAVVADTHDPKEAAAWIITLLMKHLNAEGHAVEETHVTAKQLGALMRAIRDGVITKNMGKEVFDTMYKTGRDSGTIIREQGLTVVTDVKTIEAACAEVVKAQADAATQYKAGKENILGFLVGQVMKKTKGQAPPAVINEILRKLLA